MRKLTRPAAVLLTAGLLLGLWGCAAPAPAPTQLPTPTPTADPAPAPTPTADPAPTVFPAPEEPPLLDWMADQPVPDFLDESQQQLFLHAFSAANFLMGCDTNTVEEYPDEAGEVGYLKQHETVEIDGNIYTVALGRFRRWEDFQAMLDGLFTPEYQQELLGSEMGDGTVLPHFRPTEDGLLCYIDAGRGSDIEYGWCETPDSYELVSRTEDEIVFHLIGHYVTLDYDAEKDMPVPVDEYTTAHPIRMVRTEKGWRFAEFHLPY